MNKYIAAIVLFLLANSAVFAEQDGDMWTMQDDTAYYNSLTVSADYTQRVAFKPMSYTKHELIEDIKVTAIEAIPFGFLYTFAGLWVAKAIKEKTWSPKVGTLIENQSTYYTVIGALMVVNVAINVFTFYDYNRNDKEGLIEKDKTVP